MKKYLNDRRYAQRLINRVPKHPVRNSHMANTRGRFYLCGCSGRGYDMIIIRRAENPPSSECEGSTL